MKTKNRFLEVDSNKIVISEFYENHVSGKYNYDASYQREIVWNLEKRRFLIDTILKNYPIPPIFLRMYIDNDTGATKYDVIDGKQRLTTIISFIEAEINVTDEFSVGPFGCKELDGISFKELDKYPEYKKQFWKYTIPIIYIDENDNEIIKNIFDRLNRNGEPLTAQELRNAKYSTTELYKLFKKLSKIEYINNLLKDLDIVRMENIEFISELVFTLTESKLISYTKNTLDILYEKNTQQNINLIQIEQEFRKTIDYLKALNINFEKYKVHGVSHLYALWVFSNYALKNGIEITKLSKVIDEFYLYLRDGKEDKNITEYSASMKSNTKSISSRRRRINALIKFSSKKGIKFEKFNFEF